MAYLYLTPPLLAVAITALGLCIGGPLFLISLARHRLADWRFNRRAG